MTTHIVPFELQELVVDSIYDWRHEILTATLRSCALTCRAWLPRSRRRLYHTLELSRLQPSQLGRLLELIDRDSEVPGAVCKLLVSNGWPREKEGIVQAGAVLLILAGKLPRLESLSIEHAVIDSSPARLPELAGFPTLTTLQLGSVTFTSYVAFRRMLAAAPGLRRLSVYNATWTSSRIPPTIHTSRLRCAPLKHLVWYGRGDRSAEEISLPLVHLLGNLNVCESLECLELRHLMQDFIKRLLYNLVYNPRSDSKPSPLLHLTELTVQLNYAFYTFGVRGADLSRFLESSVRLIAALWSPADRTCTQRPRKLRLEFVYERAALLPVSQASSDETSARPTEDELERILWDLKNVGTELEQALSAAACARPAAIEFVFYDQQEKRRVSKESVRDFVLSLRSRMAGIVPGLHQRGLLSVKFKSINRSGPDSEWVENGRGDFEAVRCHYSDFD